jgi:hypothetical protein
MMPVFYERTAVQLHATFKDLAGAAIDPTTVKVTWLPPGATDPVERTYQGGGSPAIVRASAGNFTIDIDVSDRSGTWRFFWQSTGTGQAAKESEFDVRNAFI